ncbi:substance-K receptor-like [Oculina patagonica]
MNNSSINNFEDQSTRSDIISTTFTAVIFFVSISAFVGNILVTVIFLMNATLRTSTNYFIVNMAVSDLLSALTNWPLYATDGMLSRKQVIADSMTTFVCKLGMYSRAVSQGVSILSFVLIVVDRFIAIVLPFQARGLTRRLRRVLFLFSWVLPLLSLFPYVWFSKIVQEGRQTVCKFSSPWSNMELYIFYTVGLLVFYCVPLILIIILYSRIMKCLTRISPVGEIHSIRIRNRQQNQVVMKIFISTVITFFLCWTPLCVYILLNMFFPLLFTKDSSILLQGLSYYVFPTLSTAVNPVIVFLSSSRFSNPLKKLFRCSKCTLSSSNGRA